MLIIWLTKKDLEKRINTLLGYHQIGTIEWKEEDLLPNGQYPLDLRIPKPRSEPRPFNTQEKPYSFSVFMERDKDKDDKWGAEHFVVTFLFADGIATYFQVFVKEYAKAPWLFLLQDHGTRGNYDCFGRGGILDAIIEESKINPEFVICGSNTPIWRKYMKVQEVSPIFGGMHNFRRDLYKYQSLC